MFLKAVDKTQLEQSASTNFIISLRKGDIEGVKTYLLKAGIIDFTILERDPSITLNTPLGIVVNALNYELCKILLEAGANPNFETRCSLIELLLCSINILEMKTGVPQLTEAVKGLKNTLIPPRFDETAQMEPIARAGKILDLLLCFGIQVKFSWSTDFQNALKSLDEEIVKLSTTAEQYRAISRNLTVGYSRGCLAADFGPHCIRSKQKLSSYLSYIKNLKALLNINISEISGEISNYSSIVAENTSLPTVLVGLVIEYCRLDICAEVHSKRLAESKNILFWSQESPAASVKAAPGVKLTG